jgi:hypothetical protein
LHRAATWTLAIPLVFVLVLALASTGRIERELDTQWHAFTHLSEPGESAVPSAGARSRLLSGSGNRYDYWRIAWRVWQEHPLIGVGAGNYPRPYYEMRSTEEDVVQPHSLELQVLSELGLLGALLLACVLAGVLLGALRMHGRARRSRLRRGLLVGASGTFAAWLVQTSVDWMHLLPGLTAIALAAAAVLVWPRAKPIAESATGRSRLHARLTGRPALAVGASAAVVTLIVAGASLSRQELAEVFRSNARHELAGNRLAALEDANRSLDIDGSSMQGYYLKAASLARFGQGSGAEAVLTRALRREPGNFVTWVLLGDISVRERDFAAAGRRYGHAHRLNPRDQTIARLARDPHTAAP